MLFKIDLRSTYVKKDDIFSYAWRRLQRVINSFRAARRGFTAAVLNCRGCAGAKFTSERAYNAYEIDDFKFSIENHVKKRNTKHIFICGFSMGAMHATRYAIDYTGDVTAIVAVSHSTDAEKSAKIVVSFHNFKNRV